MATPTEREVIRQQISGDPVLKNELNQEPWWQSGVGFFGTGGVLWSLGAILTQVGDHGMDLQAYDHAVMITAGGALITTAGVLYRRFWPGLKPMFSWLKG